MEAVGARADTGDNMSETIKKLYRGAGLTPPKGKGIHTMDFHSCVTQCAKNQGGKIKGKVNCWAVCMASLGKAKAVRKAHRK